ncbi:MAG: SUMF1/EgtB/PvdO family nonheme iron enzyme [Saprospiraceae bacterium]|nr:SUMF1/EgtB/PvdO family nonheme iron enzyme [Saprospiraceae bacterium]
MPHPPLKTFIIYARADAEYKNALRHHLTPLEDEGLLVVWDDAHLLPGEEWGKSIEDRLDESDLVLMLVSADSLKSPVIKKTELKKTLERKKQGVTQFIPVLVRDCLWEAVPAISGVQMLPLDGQRTLQPVAAWLSPDAAWASALRELLKLIPDIQQKIAADRAVQEAAQRKEQEAIQEKAAAEKAEKLRNKSDEAAWKKVLSEVTAATKLETKIEIYNAYLEDEETHLNHREEAETAIEEMDGEMRIARILAEKEAIKRLEAEAKKKAEEEAANDQMVLIKGGTFEMGDVMGDKEYDDETLHQVTLSDFYLGAYEVTFEEYDRYCEATGKEKPGDSGWGRGKLPVINVNWYDAVEYCNWLSTQRGLKAVYTIDKNTQDPNNLQKDDKLKWSISADWSANGYRLPTEAEWEYAARAMNGKGGGKVRFGNGKDIADPKEINFDGTASYKKPYSVAGEYRQKTTPVGNFSPNSLGLHDMSGNVWEWCWDWYGAYPTAAQTNPKGANSGEVRVLRGGSWGSDPLHARAAYRGWGGPSRRFSVRGFRLARM